MTQRINRLHRFLAASWEHYWHRRGETISHALTQCKLRGWEVHACNFKWNLAGHIGRLGPERWAHRLFADRCRVQQEIQRELCRAAGRPPTLGHSDAWRGRHTQWEREVWEHTRGRSGVSAPGDWRDSAADRAGWRSLARSFAHARCAEGACEALFQRPDSSGSTGGTGSSTDMDTDTSKGS